MLLKAQESAGSMIFTIHVGPLVSLRLNGFCSVNSQVFACRSISQLVIQVDMSTRNRNKRLVTIVESCSKMEVFFGIGCMLTPVKIRYYMIGAWFETSWCPAFEVCVEKANMHSTAAASALLCFA